MAKSKKYYTVWAGNKPGIYDNWAECLLQTKNFPNAKYKSFKTLEEAVIAFKSSYSDYLNKKTKVAGLGVKKGQVDLSQFANEIIADSISVDAACAGNPGIMEYRGVVTMSRKELFRIGPYIDGTNNIGEFLALVHALAMFKKVNKKTPIYTDSRTAMAWVRNKKVKTTLKKTSNNAILFELLDRATKWLHENSYTNPIIKWDTKRWGEIPADFGRK